MPGELRPRWEAFLRELDDIAPGKAECHCIGGFVITQRYGFDRDTVDLDVLTIQSPDTQFLLERAGEGSELHRKHQVYLDVVTVVQDYPDEYESRLVEMFPGRFSKIRLWALEAHDLALTKLQRNNEKDREDVKHLARSGKITPERLQERYDKEMRPYVAKPEQRTDPIMKLWLDMLRELEGRRP